MNWKAKAEKWKSFSGLDDELKSQLFSLDDKGLEEAFYKDLEFGTGGMRGEIGVGTNRMNIYTVRKASAGLAEYIEAQGLEAKKRGVVIAYDSRHKSKEFAMEAAATLATRGIQTYVFDELRPTPELSFAVRYLNASAGIVITASHNPPEYNGYKVYGSDGAQLPPHSADMVTACVEKIDDELKIKVMPIKELREQGLIKMIGEEIDNAYLDKVAGIFEQPSLGGRTNIQVVYTPLHGTGNKPVRKALEAFNYKVHVVKEQEHPDPDFSTVKVPNPEEFSSFELAIEKGKETGAELLMATDPDCDRLGIVVKDEKGKYVGLTGNQTGALLLYYLLSQKLEKGSLPKNGVMLKTIVTSELGRKIAASFGVETVDVLTGFKFIAEKIEEYERSGQYEFLFGYEESYGYLISDFVRDKDAVQAALLITEACAYYKLRGKSLYEALLDLYGQYGFYQEGLQSITLKGLSGKKQIEQIMKFFRTEPLMELDTLKVTTVEDYLRGIRLIQRKREEKISLPKSNVLKFYFEDDSWICLRPSGTEPKIKFYFSVKGENLQESRWKLSNLRNKFMKLIEETMTKMN